MAKLFRKNELNQVARRRFKNALLQATCVLSLASAQISVLGQELLTPPALPSMEAPPVLPSSQSNVESVNAGRGVSLVLRATRLLGLKKIPQIEWSAIDSQLPELSKHDIQLPTCQEPSSAETSSPSVADTKVSAPDKRASGAEESLESLLTVDLTQVNETEATPADEETDSLISAVSMSELQTQAESAAAESQSTDSLLDIDLASDTVNQPSLASRATEIVKRGPSMQLRVGPALTTVRLSDVEDEEVSDLSSQDGTPLETPPSLASGSSKSPELAKPASPRMVVTATPPTIENADSKSIPIKTISATIERELVEVKERETPAVRGGLIEPALPTQFSLNDKANDSRENQDSQDAELPLTRALAMSIESMTKSKASNAAEKAIPKDLKVSETKSAPIIQSVSAQIEQKPQLAMMRPTTPPTLGPQLQVEAGEAQSVLMQSPIVNISVEHPDYCQVVKNGEKSLSVIGLKPGKTRVAIFSAQNSVEIREVTVSGVEDEQSVRDRMAKDMARAVEKMYRSSSVEVVADEEGLVVQGFAESESDAKKIIRMIRQSSLMPVVDRLSTYK